MEEGVRIDKWLWSVRIFKTRSQSTSACRDGKVRIGEHPVKPSHEVKNGAEITVNLGVLKKTVRVRDIPVHRIGAKLVADYLEDLTPAEEYEKLQIRKETIFGFRARGTGRPTKRERRDLEILKKYLGA